MRKEHPLGIFLARTILGSLLFIGMSAAVWSGSFEELLPRPPALTPMPSLTAHPSATFRAPRTPYDVEIEMIARDYGMDPLLIKAIIAVESEFDPRSVSNRGACGLMQLMPQTARTLHVNDIFDPEQNIRGGVRHFHYLLHRFHNNLPLSLAAYDAGEWPVLHYKGIPPYRETRWYVRHILKTYKAYKTTPA